MTGSTSPTDRRSIGPIAIAIVVAMIGPPTAVLLGAAILVAATGSEIEEVTLPDIPPGSELDPGGVALLITDGTLYDDLQMEDPRDAQEDIEIADLCGSPGESTVRFVADNGDIGMTVAVVNDAGSVVVTGAESFKGDPGTTVVEDLVVGMEGAIVNSADSLRFIISANCTLPAR